MALEEAFQVTVDEAQFAAGQDRRRPRGADAAARGRRARPAAAIDGADRLSRLEPIAAGADAAPRQPADVDPAARPLFVQLEVDGLEHLEAIDGPVSSPPTIRAISIRR